MTDINEQKTMHQALLESEERYRALFKGSVDGIIILSSDGRMMEVNDVMARMHGYSVQEMQGMSLIDLDTPETSRLAPERMRRLLTGEPLTFEVEHYHRDGRIIRFEVSGSLVFSASGSHIQCVHRDITERKKIEQALLESELKYRQLFQSMLNGFALHEIICDEYGTPCDYRFLEVNPAFGQLTGLKAEYVEGRTVLEVLPDTERFWIETYGRVALNDESAHFESFSKELGRYYEVTAYSPRSGQFATIISDITERKQATELAVMAKTDWERTFDAVPDLISIIDIDRTIVRVNKAMAAHCGLSPEEISGRKCFEVVHGLHAPPRCCPSVAMLKDGVIHAADIHEITINKVFDVTVSPIFDDHGRITSYVHVMRDISEQKRTQELVNQRLKFRDTALICDVDGLMQAALDACELLTDSSVGLYYLVGDEKHDIVLKAVSTSTLAAIPGNLGHGVSHIYRSSSQTECLCTGEPVVHNDCAALTTDTGLTSAFPQILREVAIPVIVNGKIVSIIVIGNKSSSYTEHDIHLLKQFIVFAAEVIERKRVHTALKESEERFRNLMERVPAITYNYSRERGGLFYSPQVEQIFGYPRQAFYDDPLLWKNSIHPDDADMVRKTVESLADNGISGFDIEYRVHNRDGRWIWLHDSSALQEVSDNDVVIHGIAQDITRIKDAEDERHKLEKQFQETQRLESLGVLTGGIAHDFNNILTIILGHCYMVKENFDPAITDKEHVEQIEAAANRAADLCRQMLAYAGNSSIEDVQVNLWLMIDEIARMLRAVIRKNVDIRLELKRDVPEISGDTAQVQQVIMNLIINAAEAIGERNGTVRVMLDKKNVSAGQDDRDHFGDVIPPGGYAVLEVSDNGCGMSEEVRNRIFEPFFTTKFTGRGLGMSAVLGIIKSHNGALQLSSSPGAGTSFKVFFPLGSTMGAPETVKTSVAVTAEPAKGAVLLVDDEPAICAIGSALLKALGFSCVTANNGIEAVDACRKSSSGIDLILLDMIMPEMGGLDTYREIRKINPTVPVVFCSGYGVDGILENLDDDTGVAAIQKPFNPEELRDVLIRLISC